eukprot:scaffold71965_cov30-Tisochrysis_lutea.AAC.3
MTENEGEKSKVGQQSKAPDKVHVKPLDTHIPPLPPQPDCQGSCEWPLPASRARRSRPSARYHEVVRGPTAEPTQGFSHKLNSKRMGVRCMHDVQPWRSYGKT